MKNLIIGPAFPLRGGIANFNEALCAEFIKENIDSKIISFSLQYPSFLFPGKTQFDEGTAPEGIPISTEIISINPFNWFGVAQRIRKAKPDYIIVRYWLPFMAPCLGMIARRVKNGTGIKVIAIIDNAIPHEKRFGDHSLTKFFVNSCDGFIVMSKSVEEDLKTFTTNRHIHLSPHPVYNIFGEKIDKSEARRRLELSPIAPPDLPKNGEEQKYILFFGFIRKYKGLDLLLEAMSDEGIRSRGVKLIVAGEFYEDRSYYDEIISRHGLQNDIILHTNYIPKELVKYYFCAADLVVQPYHTATQSGVGQIAFHFEKPMLVTDVGGLGEMVKDKVEGYVVKKDINSIVEAIIDYYDNNREKEFSANVAIGKKRFEWSEMVGAIQEAYGELRMKE